MKHVFQALWCTILIGITLGSTMERNFTIHLKPTWEDLEQDRTRASEFGGKWILVGTITFKKKAKEPVLLKEIVLKWDGPHIQNLSASLYIKKPEGKFIPIEENLICDGIWNESKQYLSLLFEESQKLSAHNPFYLVLTIPQELEPILKSGAFIIKKTCLPAPFKKCVSPTELALNIPVVSSATRRS